jgi:hypothetical protein
MTIAYELPKELNDSLDKLARDLRTFVDAQREARSSKDGDRPEGDRGVVHEVWIEELRDLAISIRGVDRACPEEG